MGRFYAKSDVIKVPEYISNKLKFADKIQHSFSHKLNEIDKDLENLFKSGKKYIVRKDHFSTLNHAIRQNKVNQAYLSAFITLDYFCHKLRAKDIENQIHNIEKYKVYLEKRLEKIDLPQSETKLEWFYVLNTSIDSKKVDDTIKKPLLQFLKTQKTLVNPEVQDVSFNFINARRRLYEINSKQIELLRSTFNAHKAALVHLISNDIHPSDFSPFIVVSLKENKETLILKLVHPLNNKKLKSWILFKHKNQYENLTNQEMLSINGIMIINYMPEIPTLKPVQKFFRNLGFHHIGWEINRFLMYLRFKFSAKN